MTAMPTSVQLRQYFGGKVHQATRSAAQQAADIEQRDRHQRDVQPWGNETASGYITCVIPTGTATTPDPGVWLTFGRMAFIVEPVPGSFIAYDQGANILDEVKVFGTVKELPVDPDGLYRRARVSLGYYGGTPGAKLNVGWSFTGPALRMT